MTRNADASQPTNGSSERVCLVIIGGLILLRLGFLAFPDLFPEEAYYWLYAKRLSIGYLDHPPIVAWLIAAGTSLFGDHEFGVRIGAFLCSLVTSFWVYRLTLFLYDKGTALLAVLLAQVLPFFFLTGFMITPDAPLTACWAGMLYYLARVLIGGSTRAWWGVGLWLGLGMLSKYTIALLGPATLLYLLLDSRSRVWFRRPAPYLAVGLAIVIFTPVLWWNAHHEWASFAFQSKGRIAEARRFSSHELLLSILALLTPVGALLAGKSLFSRRLGFVTGETNEKHRRLFAQVFTLLPLAVFCLFSITHRVKLNWTGPLWLGVLPSVAASLSLLADGPRNLLRTGWTATVAVLVTTYALLVIYLTHGLPGVAYARNIEVLPVGWSELGRALEGKTKALQLTHPEPVYVVGLDRNFIASEAAFYHSNPAESVIHTTGSHLFGGKALMYEFWFPEKIPDGSNMLLVTFNKPDLTRRIVRDRCRSLGDIEELALSRAGKAIRPVFTRAAFGYRNEVPLAQ